MLLADLFSLARVFVGATILFLVPGCLILSPLRRQIGFTRVETLCAASALSLAIIPLTLYLSSLIGLRQSPEVVLILLAVACLLLLLSTQTGRMRAWFRPTATAPYDLAPSHDSSPRRVRKVNFNAGGGWLALIFLATLLGRLWSVEGIHYPLWTDSYGHTLIASLIEHSGQIPVGYEPFAPIHDFTYHFGFHTIAVWTHWVTGLPLPRSVLLAGQIMNALVVPTTFLFASRLFRNAYVGLVAALVAGLLSHMPSQFVNWGRYTQLCGQILLPVALVFWLELLRTKSSKRFSYAALTILAFGGLFLVHYRIFIFAALLAAPALMFALFLPAESENQEATPRRQPSQTNAQQTMLLANEVATPSTSRIALLGYALLTGMATLILIAPWIARLLGGFGSQFAQEVAGGYDPRDHGEYFDFSLRYIFEFGAHAYLLALALVAALWGLLARNRNVWLLFIWLILLAVTANLHLVGITPFYSTTIVILFLYFPVSVLIGYLTGRVLEFFAAAKWHPALTQPSWLARGWAVIGLAIVITVGVYAIVRDRDLVAPENGLVQSADEEAIAWIKQNIAEDSLFYIATTFWTPRVAHGLDAGYWLPLLAERQTIMPPQKYASDGEQNYMEFINQRLRTLEAATDPEEFWQRLNEFGITHIYIGARKTDLNPQRFVDHPDWFRPLYAQDNVWIFAIVHS